MKKIDNRYMPSTTDVNEAMAHARALARKDTCEGHIEDWMMHDTREIKYLETYDNSSFYNFGERGAECIGTMDRHTPFACWGSEAYCHL